MRKAMPKGEGKEVGMPGAAMTRAGELVADKLASVDVPDDRLERATDDKAGLAGRIYVRLPKLRNTQNRSFHRRLPNEGTVPRGTVGRKE
jgi:hypothetical protein